MSIFFPGNKLNRKKRQPVWREPAILEPTQEIRGSALPQLSRRQIIALSVAIGLGVAVWFALASPVFSVKQLEVDGDVKDETRAEIDKFKGRNIFLL
ncbi:hypothetical protein HY065_02830, partial [Candidatus Berkelbacteria bacterium]|nr:hypothetical protein [Candidatus Berkelbacteria bacterium]